MLSSGEKRALSVIQAIYQQCFQITDQKSFNNTVSFVEKVSQKLANICRTPCAWVWFLLGTTWNFTASTNMVISNGYWESWCIKEVLFYLPLQANERFRSPRCKKHQQTTGHLASQTCIILPIFPLFSAFLEILKCLTPYKTCLWSRSWGIFFQNYFKISFQNACLPSWL